ncbi:hypothetical protein [Pusillimonas sp. ANT_WB101]|uniref:hypothetical protein n=1 Tax=Pusillimonas sp. ANT_WB101 TaxID=2597356 RepID=UPI0011EF38EF|nr:hypothetical protein [Pusillimonas sp. ANT_WB101]KAA0911504.1 hypothetical protein FQ179_06675 [Pusillimonas sp. ANT_WB101]
MPKLFLPEPGPSMRWHVLARVLLAVASAASSVAIAAPPKMATLKGVFNETISQDVVVSGAVIVGVSDNSVIDGKALGSLAIISEANSAASEVCLSVLTRDGVYMASNQYVFPPDTQPGDIVLLPYKKSLQLPFLAKYANLEVAVQAANGSCDAPTGNTYVVHRSDSAEQHQLRLYINSFNATDVYASFSDQNAVDCVPVEGRRTSFDYVCNVDVPAALKGAAEVTIEREIYGRELPKASVTVLYGGTP